MARMYFCQPCAVTHSAPTGAKCSRVVDSWSSTQGSPRQSKKQTNPGGNSPRSPRAEQTRQGAKDRALPLAGVSKNCLIRN